MREYYQYRKRSVCKLEILAFGVCCAALWTATGFASAPLTLTGFQLDDYPVHLCLVSNDNCIDLLVSYRRPTNGYSKMFDWDEASKIGTRENRLLVFFLDNQALRYLEGDSLDASVIIKCKTGSDKLEQARKMNRRWFFGDENIEYCERTLALRSGKQTIDVLPEKTSNSDVWMRWNRDSYAIWWKRLDEQIHFDQVFESGK